MDISKISSGKHPPDDINVIIEIPQGSAVKYEVDKESGALVVDRFLFTSTAYPAAYGFIPGTLADDGDPLDAMVLVPAQVVPGAVIRCRPLGVLIMEDEAGLDEKVICVPHDKIHPHFSEVTSVDGLPEITRSAIEHFFGSYKDLEKGKWVKVKGWKNLDVARQLIVRYIDAAKKK